MTPKENYMKHGIFLIQKSKLLHIIPVCKEKRQGTRTTDRKTPRGVGGGSTTPKAPGRKPRVGTWDKTDLEGAN